MGVSPSCTSTKVGPLPKTNKNVVGTTVETNTSAHVVAAVADAKKEAIALYEMFIALAKLIVVNAKLWNLLDEWYKAYFSKTTETEKRTFLFNQKVAMEQNVKAFFQSELHTSFNAICGLFNMLHQTMKAEEVVAATMVEFDCVSVEDWLKKLQPVLAESLELSQNLYRLAENFILLSI